MKNIKIKLCSNYQTIELEIDDISEDLSKAVQLVNQLGNVVINADKGVKQDMATERQIEILKRYHVEHPERLTKKEASKKLDELLGK